MKSIRIVIAVLCFAAMIHAQEKYSPKVVRVVGTSEVKVAPDRVVIELGVYKQAGSAGAAKASEDAAARKLLVAIRANGIDDKDIQTTYLSLQPQVTTHKGVRSTYFVAQQTLTVLVRDLPKLDTVLESVIKAGGNRIDSVRYEVSDLRKYRDQARDMAVKAAREKAQALAAGLGQEIGKAHSIEEVPEFNGEYNFAVQNSAAFDRGIRASSTSAGQERISASVIVTFDLI
jgi:uncharacterized protein YggE